MKVKSLGLELRKIDNVTSLYKDVDIVLSQTPATEIARQTIAHSLNKMTKSSNHFSVCTIDNCAKIANICIPREHKDIYNAVHCVHWDEMTDEYRKILVAMILNDFRIILIPEENTQDITTL